MRHFIIYILLFAALVKPVVGQLTGQMGNLDDDWVCSKAFEKDRFVVADSTLELQRIHFFDMAPMDDPLPPDYLQYAGRVDEYLKLYYLGTLSDTILPVEEYYKAVDIIMANVSNDPELRSFIVDHLLEQFDFFGLEMVQIYIAENYPDEQCESDIIELVLSRMEGYKGMQPGHQAPDFVIQERNNQTIRLSGMDNPYILVMFLASTCEHCEKMIPKLHEWYVTENRLDMEFVTISIDTSQFQWEEFIDQYQLSWICAHDALGWNGQVPREYNLYATPSLFLLDNNRKILAKPHTYREFLKAIRGL